LEWSQRREGGILRDCNPLKIELVYKHNQIRHLVVLVGNHHDFLVLQILKKVFSNLEDKDLLEVRRVSSSGTPCDGGTSATGLDIPLDWELGRGPFEQQFVLDEEEINNFIALMASSPRIPSARSCS